MATEPDNQTNLSDNRTGERIQTGGGAYIGGNVTSSGGVNVWGGTVGDVTYTNNRLMSPADEATLRELFATLHQQIDTATNTPPEDKADAKEAAQTLEQFAHAALGEPSTEGFLDPIADLSGGLETPGGDLLLELVELGLGQSAGVALVLQSAEGLEALGPEESDPVVDRPRAHAEQVSDFLCRIVLVQPQQRRQTLVDARVLLLAA